MTIEQLYELAAIEFPLDGVTCSYKKKKIYWQRDKWVEAKLAEQSNK